MRAAPAPEAPRASEFDAPTEEIVLNEINTTDRILIRTQNSEYRFAVVDAESRRGKLSGGPLGSESQDATLAGVLIGSHGNAGSDTSTLKIDCCAIFYVNVGTKLKRLTTSAITNLILIRGDRPQRGVR